MIKEPCACAKNDIKSVLASLGCEPKGSPFAELEPFAESLIKVFEDNAEMSYHFQIMADTEALKEYYRGRCRAFSGAADFVKLHLKNALILDGKGVN